MAKRTGKKKVSTRTRAARKGWETRRARAELEARKKAHAAAKRRATAAAKKEQKRKRSEASKKGARRHKARVRAGAALEALVHGVDSKARHGLIDRLRESWRSAKRDVYDVADSYEDYLDILEQISEETDVTWDIAYGPDGEAAA